MLHCYCGCQAWNVQEKEPSETQQSQLPRIQTPAIALGAQFQLRQKKNKIEEKILDLIHRRRERDKDEEIFLKIKICEGATNALAENLTPRWTMIVFAAHICQGATIALAEKRREEKHTNISSACFR